MASPAERPTSGLASSGQNPILGIFVTSRGFDDSKTTMGNVASWAGSKTLTCFEYYDQAVDDYFGGGRDGKFKTHIHTNYASMLSGKSGVVTRGFKNIENEGYFVKQNCYDADVRRDQPCK